MPHITFPLADLRALAGEPDLTIERVGELAQLVKGELKARASTEEEVKVELQDTNRPDTWCVEGMARQIRQRGEDRRGAYAFFDAPPPGNAPEAWIEVDRSVEEVRPFVAGFRASGYAVDEAGLRAFISAQEVLSRNFGRMRKGVAIGIYDASRITFPVRYEAAPADDERRAFVPLSPSAVARATGEEVPDVVLDGEGRPVPAARWKERWTPAQILRDHPTGREYAGALPDLTRAPLLVDAREAVLSFPPVINSADLGRVRVGMDDLFVEVTGTSLDQVLLAANILAANLADRGATIAPIGTRYPFDTPRGREVLAPHPLADRRTIEVPLSEFGRLLGEPGLEAMEVTRHLEAFGLRVEALHEGQAPALRVSAPAYRADYLHAVDAIEDFAISRGYQALEPLLPEEFTVGGLSPATRFGDLLRELAIGCGFEETIGNLLTAEEDIRARMLLEGPESARPPLHGGPPVRLKNVMNRNYSVLRDWVLPTLMQIEGHSTSALYPHRFFELGEVCVWDDAANHRSRSELRLAALVAADEVGFSETQSYLHGMLRTLGLRFAPNLQDAGAAGLAYALEPAEHPSFIPGRAAWVVTRTANEPRLVLGIIGEVHPGVLERWKIYFPTGGFELLVEPLRRVVG